MDMLGIYLNDHLGGSTLGVELVKRAAGSNQDNEYGATLAVLAREIEEDRDTLLRLMDDLGFGKDHLKVTGGWVAEKLGRLKLNGSLVAYSPLSRLVEFEGLYLGVTGKLSLWTNLRASLGDRVGGVNLVELADQARSQQSRLEELRSRAAAEALGTARVDSG